MLKTLLKFALIKKVYDWWRNRDKPQNSGV
jgi:hypothetical protein